MHKLIFTMLFLFSLCLNAGYKIESIETPKGVDSQIGGIDFMPDGRLVMTYNYGKVFTYNPKTKEWKLFAEGLHMPLGVVALNNYEIVVMQRPELTKIIDRDKDGKADSYRTLFDDFGVSGNYHEFAFGPVRDKEGNFYISLNVASNNGGILPGARGEFKSYDIDQKSLEGKFDKNKVSRMYSCVPYRGWVIKISPDGVGTPYASGLRSPNGLGFDHKGRLLVTDNQGDWLGSSKLHHVQEGAFHGHPASLVWKDGWNKNPMDASLDELNKLRTPAAAFFPQGIIANSPTQPLLDTTNGKFGPFSNQMFIGEMNFKRLVRFIPDEVNGVLQGTVIPFLDSDALDNGNNRLVFAPDGSLWIGKMHLSWAGNKGLKRISWDGKTDFDILDIKQTAKGFDLTFTKEIEALNVEDFKISSYRFDYHSSYGSKRQEEALQKVKLIKLSEDKKTVHIELPPLTKGFVYQFDLETLKSGTGKALSSSLFCYNLIEVLSKN